MNQNNPCAGFFRPLTAYEPKPAAPVEVTVFPKLCCGRPTQTQAGKSHCPVCQ
jgi:hypothetical protein